MKVLFDVSSLNYKILNADGIYTKSLFRLLRGLGVDIDPVYSRGKRGKANFIEHHLGYTAKKFRPFFIPKGSIQHGPSGSLLTESDKFKKVISVNDLSMFRDGFHSPGLAEQLQNHLKQQMQNSLDAILVPSYDVHNEILIRFPKFMNRVHVVQPGCDHIFENSNLGGEKPYEKPYFLFSGTIDKKSNVSGAVKAFDALCSINKSFLLVITGGDGFGAEAIRKLIGTSAHKEHFKVLGYQSDAQLKKLYSSAIATVIPSFYEGFPYSMVEAMKIGCPVLSSAIGTMKEVGGEAFHAVNPKDPEQIMAGMERIYVDKIYREKLIETGKEITEKMTWLKTAREVTSIYQKI